MTEKNCRPPATCEIDTTVPHPARMYDYYLGGKDNFPADQEAAERVRKAVPFIQTVALENRGFMHRATRTLAGEYGVRQFVDIGSGIPTSPNLHEVAQDEAPECRVVYVDNDPMVLDYTDVLVLSAPEGCAGSLQADVRYDAVLDHPDLLSLIDLDRPVALSLNAVMHFVPDEDAPYEIVQSLVDRLCPGSFLALSHVTSQFDPEAWATTEKIYRKAGTPARARTEKEIRTFFAGLELVDPGLTSTHLWRPGRDQGETTASESSMLAAVARKPFRPTATAQAASPLSVNESREPRSGS
ncbi:SAM-dependent methyltransferase [Streptomyces nanshensis]|uniref:SAM-dependent methyltransferase n=1 Tax=Streptomyces nanshensis TaxID=518642 RepID=UPI00085C041E|nr:SAM-dependent methyltransferase [Streptomyces nanshensis]